MNEHFKKQLERYINGDVDSIYDSMTSEPKISKKKHHHKEKPSSSIPQQQPQQQQFQQQSKPQQQPQQQHQQPQHSQLFQPSYENTLHPVYSPYDDYNVMDDYEKQRQERNYEEISLREKYAVDYLDKSNFETIKQNGVEMAKKILTTQNKIDYYKAIKKKTSLKLEEYNKRKENDCDPLIEFLLHTNIDYIEHDGHKFSLVNGKNKKYIKISKTK